MENRILSACEIYRVLNKNLNPEAAVRKKSVCVCACVCLCACVSVREMGWVPFLLLEVIGFIYFTVFKDKIN